VRVVHLAVALALGASCSRATERHAPVPHTAPEHRAENAPALDDPVLTEALRPLPPTVLPARARVVAIGDLHGYADAARNVLRVAGVTDAEGHWTAGEAALVQTGDALDRGDQDRAVLDLLDALKDQAARAGG